MAPHNKTTTRTPGAVRQIIARLRERHPDAHCELD